MDVYIVIMDGAITSGVKKIEAVFSTLEKALRYLRAHYKSRAGNAHKEFFKNTVVHVWETDSHKKNYAKEYLSGEELKTMVLEFNGREYQG